MTKKIRLLPVILLITLLFVYSNASATMIRLTPPNNSVAVGDTFGIGIVADIDPTDAITAFGFDLVLSGSGTLAFNGFTPNSPLFDIDPIHVTLSDGDGILGATFSSIILDYDFAFGDTVSGNNLVLGDLSFTATGVGGVLVSLGADDLNFNYTEGLIPLYPANLFMPGVSGAAVTIAATSVPEPSSLILLGAFLCGIVGFERRKRFKK